MSKFKRLISAVMLVLIALGGNAVPSNAQGDVWCIRESANAGDCEISRAADKTLTYRLPKGFSLVMSNLLDGNQRVRILQNGNQLQEFIAGMPNAPLNTIVIPLTQSFNLYGVLTARTDGIFEIGTGAARSFYIPVNGGIMLIPVGDQYMTLWLLGGNSTVEFDDLSLKVQERIERIENYLEIDQVEERAASNYFLEEPVSASLTSASMSLSDNGDSPDCCCGGTGKKTLLLGLGGRGSESGAEVEAAFNALDEHDKECVEFRRYPYYPNSCAKEVAQRLAVERDLEARSAEWCTVKTAAHSQAGIIAAYAAAESETRGLETHTMGSPLQGAYAGMGISMGTLWTVGYLLPVPGASLVMDLASDCMFSEAASTHNYPSLFCELYGERYGPTGTVVTHTHEPTSMFPLSTQTGGPEGSVSEHHPGTDHVSVVAAAIKSISSKSSCTKCGDGIVDGAEECEGEGSSCTTSGGAAGKCSSKCKCESLCGNGTLDPGEECDTPGSEEICLCSFLGMHKVQCTAECKIPGCDHPADPTPTPPQHASQKPSPSPSPSPSSTPVHASDSDEVLTEPTQHGSAPLINVPGLMKKYPVEVS